MAKLDAAPEGAEVRERPRSEAGGAGKPDERSPMNGCM
jgi:hypothetical protein